MMSQKPKGLEQEFNSPIYRLRLITPCNQGIFSLIPKELSTLQVLLKWSQTTSSKKQGARKPMILGS